MVPTNAIKEKVIQVTFNQTIYSCAVYDVSHLLREESDSIIKSSKKNHRVYKKRDPKNIQYCILHKSGAKGPSGYKGVLGTTRFVVTQRGWYGPAYTFWVSAVPDIDEDGNIVIYRMNTDDISSYHTGHGMNSIGIGIGVQGNFDSDWDFIDGVLQSDIEPTLDQKVALEALIKYCIDRYGIDIHAEGDKGPYLTGHWEHGKSVCPGDYIRNWIMNKRGNDLNKTKSLSVKQIQNGLKKLGYNPGPIDGIFGYRTRTALEKFQKYNGLLIDGWYGKNTSIKLIERLKSIGYSPEKL